MHLVAIGGSDAGISAALVVALASAPAAQWPGRGCGREPGPGPGYRLADLVHEIPQVQAGHLGMECQARAQDASISPAQRHKNLAIMNMQQDITAFESQFNGTYPFTSDGIVVGTPPASFEEEMQTMIAFAGGQVGLSVLYHENMHQWWGDNVTEGGYQMTFFKEGMATVAQYLLTARQAEAAAGGPHSSKGQAAFQASLVKQFNRTYASAGSFWTAVPSNPTPFGLFSGSATYARPAAAYLALRQILGKANFTRTLQRIQRDYAGSHITEPELKAAFRQWLPNRSGACQATLSEFFTEWFDTAYARGGGANRPQITGPGLAGPGFYNTTGGCTAAG